MKICMVTLDSPTQGIGDGITSHVDYLSKNLGRQGHRIWVIALNSDVTSVTYVEDGNVTNVSIPCNHRSLLLKMLVLHREAKKIIEDLDSIHSFDVFHGHGGYVSPISAYKTDSPKVLTIHNTFEYDRFLEFDYLEKKDHLGWLGRKLFYPYFLLRAYRKWYYDSVDHIIAVTKHNQTVTSENFSIPSEKFSVIPNGFDSSEIIETHGNVKPSHLLYFGRLEPHKGPQVLIKAIAKVRLSYPTVSLGIAGDGTYLEQLKKLVIELGLEDFVEFYGRLGRQRLYEEIESAGGVVIPSYFEGIPVALFEAASMSKPIIASGLPGVKEVLDGQSCVFFESGNVDQLASKISWVLENQDQAEILGLTANKVIKTKYDWSTISSNTLKLYEKIVNGED